MTLGTQADSPRDFARFPGRARAWTKRFERVAAGLYPPRSFSFVLSEGHTDDEIRSASSPQVPTSRYAGLIYRRAGACGCRSCYPMMAITAEEERTEKKRREPSRGTAPFFGAFFKTSQKLAPTASLAEFMPRFSTREEGKRSRACR